MSKPRRDPINRFRVHFCKQSPEERFYNHSRAIFEFKKVSPLHVVFQSVRIWSKASGAYNTRLLKLHEFGQNLFGKLRGDHLDFFFLDLRFGLLQHGIECLHYGPRLEFVVLLDILDNRTAGLF